MNTKQLATAFFALITLSCAAQVPQILNYQGRVAVNGTNFTGSGQFKFALVDGGQNSARTAAATATISGGFLTVITVTDGGFGYTVPPTVTATGGGGSNAVLSANISGGAVTSVDVINPGHGYTSPPTITFSAPTSSVTYTTRWSNDGSSTTGNEPTTAVTLPVSKGLYSVQLGDTNLSNMSAIPFTVFTNTDVRVRVWFNDGSNGFQQFTPDQRIAAVGYAMIAASVPDGSITANKIAPGSIGAAQLAPDVGSYVSWQTPTGTNVQGTANSSYILTNETGRTTLTLPGSPAIGDRFRISATAGGWLLHANTGQTITASPQFQWTAHETNRYWSAIACSADGTKLAAVDHSGSDDLGYGGFIYTSSDSGVTWMPHGTNNNWTSIASSADGSILYAVGLDTQIYKSTDSGTNWTSSGPSDLWVSIACSSDGTKAIAAPNSNVYGESSDAGHQLFISTNTGVTWTTNATPAYWTSVACSSDGTKLIAGTQNYSLYTSSDSGNTWVASQLAPFGGFQTVASSADGSKLIAASGRSLYGYDSIGGPTYFSTDSGQTWQAGQTSAQWTSIALSADGTKAVGATYNGPMFTSTDPAATWFPTDTQRYWSSVASSSDGRKLAAVVFGGQIYTYNYRLKSLLGAGFSSLELVYIGNGLWQPVSQTGTIMAQ